ncbi:membrane protein containing DUF1504 [Candidatus Magnetomorum sp. HK-1]|nr:membrane protein containing DUF1504 [Candidatus Magnetomorum sp. HK-1]
MSFKRTLIYILPVLLGFFIFSTPAFSAGGNATLESAGHFPKALDSYDDAGLKGIFSIIIKRAQEEPFNVIATLIFLLAILHTFLTSHFLKLSHQWEKEHQEKIKSGKSDKYSVSHKAELFHFLGEVEAVFGIWAAALVIAITIFYDWSTALYYINHDVNFTEAMFVVVIMTLAATRPILKLAEFVMWKIANLMGGTLTAWWFTILTIGPILGSFITEPAAMTISALLLSSKFYDLEPSEKFKYATIGLLFVNISVGGTFSHFAAPPVLMVAGPWNWGMGHMFFHFGWKAGIGILLANGLYYLFFKEELNRLQKQFSILMLKESIQKKYLRQKDLEAEFDKIGCLLGDKLGFSKEYEAKSKQMKKDIGNVLMIRHQESFTDENIDPNLVKEAYEQRFDEIRRRKMRNTIPGLLPEHEQPIIMDPEWDSRDDEVPLWVMLVHISFMIWTIYNAHYPAIFVPGLLFFLGFAQVTAPYQNSIDLKPALLVGFFLGGLVIHGGLQGWWIVPVLESLGEVPLMFSATLLTAFNDNAAITFLSTLVPGFTDGLKYAVVAGAVAGGGLTVIANAPNPAGQSILKKYFVDGISPFKLLMGSALPTAIMIICFLIFK